MANQCVSVRYLSASDHQPSGPSRSILALPRLYVTYMSKTRTIKMYSRGGTAELQLVGETFWEWFDRSQLESSCESDQPPSSASMSGFRGGWLGWFGYEMKSESLDGYPQNPSTLRFSDSRDGVDACWAWVDSFLEQSEVGEWIARGVVRARLPGETASSASSTTPSFINWMTLLGIDLGLTDVMWDEQVTAFTRILSGPSVETTLMTQADLPQLRPALLGDEYKQHIEQCREAIRRGDSYELTMTTQFISSTAPAPTDPFELYTTLRRRSPACYSAYLHFPTIDMSILSFSPERFVKVQDGVVEMKPIKGTRPRVFCQCPIDETDCAVRSVPCAHALEEDARQGEELLHDPKERAENLMVGCCLHPRSRTRSSTSFALTFCRAVSHRP